METWTRSVLCGCLALAACDGGGVKVTGNVSDFLTADAVPGVDICVYPSTTTCAETDANGDFSLELHALGDVTLSQSASGYITKLSALDLTAAPSPFTFQMIEIADLDFLASIIGVKIDPTKSVFSINVNGSDKMPEAGVTLTASGGDGDGPYYRTASSFDKTLTATTTQGFAVWVNGSPGTRAVMASAPSQTCTPANSTLPGSGAATVQLPLVMADLTSSSFTCE